MADHVLIAWCFGLFATLQLAVLVILGLQLREAVVPRALTRLGRGAARAPARSWVSARRAEPVTRRAG
jgi:hypothetical protein